ncbi:LacI family DNA-binding transcriptional regulator [Catenulispora yoronensis]|uniref:LacI family DNA-binding transcriptional regulator n=1 Tax=Catenulispora yoronensis TaxID=450799 RepID=A0ABP5G7W0_9ACTN
MAATLKDVAALAGVSIKTVSNVVNGYGFVKPENRRRVEEALEATGYRPNVGARNLRRGRTGFIAMVVPELSVPYFGELVSLVISAAADHDWNVLIEQTQGVRDRERDALSALGPHMVDGAILSPEALTAEDLAVLDPGVPFVMLGEHSVHAAADHVAIDNVAAAKTAVAHLAALGRTRIAAIGANPARGTATLRLRGYTEALTEAGLPINETLIAPAAKYHRREGAQAMATFLDLPEPPDAVFCFNDLLAIGALRTAADRGLWVPEDLAVVGFDNIEESAYAIPRLTTVAPDKQAIAETAVNLLHSRVVDRDNREPQTIQAAFRLEVRGSSRPRAATRSPRP